MNRRSISCRRDIIETGFRINKKDELVYLTIPCFEKTNLVKHCFTTRLGGVSKGIYSSLNTSKSSGDSLQNVNLNLKIICNEIGVNFLDLVYSKQSHTDNILVIDSNNINSIREKGVCDIDALVTNVPGIPLMMFFADCVPIFVLDPVMKVIGIVHSGWKGTVLRIIQKTLSVMETTYGTKLVNCLIGIGPSIQKDCFEVDNDVASKFEQEFNGYKDFVISKSGSKYYIDLWEINKRMLIESGILPQNITISNMCTKCNKEFFFSHRRDNTKRGSMSAIIELK